MSETMCYADNFSRSFGEQQECLQFLREREENASWHSIPTKEVRFEAIDESSTSGKVLCDWYRLMGKEGILQDTMANTQLLLRAEDALYPVRSCALSTILSRARISGHALSKVSKPVLAQILNHCVSVASGNALLRLSDEKVSAMHGGDESEYAVLEIPELFQAVTDQLENEACRRHQASGLPGRRALAGPERGTPLHGLRPVFGDLRSGVPAPVRRSQRPQGGPDGRKHLPCPEGALGGLRLRRGSEMVKEEALC